MNYAIEVSNLSKKFNIRHQTGGFLSLREQANRMIANPWQSLKDIRRQKREVFWALRDVSFTVNQGEVVGVIGANGSGKSTLLKILSRITPPTSGQAKIMGRVTSLIEVGTGFHPELTGRENIFLNGAILGMANKEIMDKFNQIVEFSGVEKFLDTPIKHYSSGMYVRLAFSVAIHMEPDVLIIDEVLAVGDAEFQERCAAEIKEVAFSQGRTVLMVSHDLELVKSLCRRAILLESGGIKMVDEADKVVDRYLSNHLAF